MTSTATTMDAHQLLVHWLDACAVDPWDALTPKAAEPYAYIWNAWVRHLGEKPWHEAGGIDVRAFLNAVESAALNKHDASDVTRRRYWRVLDRVYEHAEIFGWAHHNPAQAVADSERPPSENPVGAVLSMRMWVALAQDLPAALDASSARDRAILMMLMELALTTQELRSIEVGDIADGTLQVSGPRQHQPRALAMSEALQEAISGFLRHRLNAASPLLFVTRGDGPISTPMLQRMTTKYLRGIAHRHALPEPAKQGPQIIRNTAIVHWLLDGMPLRDAVARAGLKSPHSLTNIREHLPAPVRAIIATSGIGRD